MLAYLEKKTSAAPLAVFRIMLGTMLFLSLARFWSKGWIYELYIKPRYFFSFFGFEFVKPLGEYTYLLFALCMISALFVAAGFYYKTAMITLFASFTYIELIDKSTYLNHYYFISLLCLIMIFLPAHVYFSIDAYRNRKLLSGFIPRWCIDVIKLLVFILYFYAGLAKINSDWLLYALPLRIWLPARNDLAWIGFIFDYDWVPFVFSWFGCLYDLSIVFFLNYTKTRVAAYLMVIVFHLMTAALFPIGMFPYIMIGTALIFFSAEFHQRVIRILSGIFKVPSEFLQSERAYGFFPVENKCLAAGFTVFFVFQLLFPFRYILYPGELFWTEQGYRFSWRVMLMEKAGHAQFIVKDQNGHQVIVNNSEFLSTLQEKMMATQPDFILQYAHILKDYYSKHGFQSPQVYADAYVVLNGRLGKPLINPNTDLAREEDSFQAKSWITPLKDEIKGF